MNHFYKRIWIVGLLCALPGTRSFAATISNPSYLQVNLGPVPLDAYDTSHMASGYGLTSACPSGATVRGCYQTILQNWHAQKVQGVRFQFAFCGGGYSTALSGCGGSYTSVTGPTQAWLANVNNFFYDIYHAGILNVTITPSQFGFGGDSLKSVTYSSPPTGPGGTTCHDTPLTVYYWAAAPFGTKLVSTSGGQTWYPIGQGDNSGYNCAPANPYFVGWTNTYNVANALIGKAQSSGLTVFEFDDSNELDLFDFPVELRFIVDNAQTQTGNPDSLNTLRYAMGTAHSFDIGRVTWSAPGPNSSLAGYNCTDVYTDYARMLYLDEQASGIAGGLIGYPSSFSVNNNLVCGGGTSGMYQVPMSHTQPDVVDFHSYPCVANPSSGLNCYTTDSQAQVQQEATINFSDIPHFQLLVNLQSAVVVVGETHSNTNAGSGLSCEGAPLTAPGETVSGFNASGLAGRTTYFRPWSNLTVSCYSYPTNQQINVNNGGPYTPTLQ